MFAQSPLFWFDLSMNRKEGFRKDGFRKLCGCLAPPATTGFINSGFHLEERESEGVSEVFSGGDLMKF
jgi:hypothetical protein